MMHKSNIHDNIRYKVCKESIMTATQLDGLLVIKHKVKKSTCYEYCMVSVSKFESELCTWGESEVVNKNKIEIPNMEDHGTMCMFVG